MDKRSTDLKDYFLRDINPVIRFLIVSDTVISGASGLLGPIFALFIEILMIILLFLCRTDWRFKIVS